LSVYGSGKATLLRSYKQASRALEWLVDTGLFDCGEVFGEVGDLIVDMADFDGEARVRGILEEFFKQAVAFCFQFLPNDFLVERSFLRLHGSHTFRS